MTPPNQLSVVQLKRDQIVLGVLAVRDLDFPWINCAFEPTPAFAEVQPLFEAEAAIGPDDEDAWIAAYEAIMALNLRLIDAVNGDDLGEGEFLLHIDGDQAQFRY